MCFISAKSGGDGETGYYYTLANLLWQRFWQMLQNVVRWCCRPRETNKGQDKPRLADSRALFEQITPIATRMRNLRSSCASPEKPSLQTEICPCGLPSTEHKIDVKASTYDMYIFKVFLFIMKKVYIFSIVFVNSSFKKKFLSLPFCFILYNHLCTRKKEE